MPEYLTVDAGDIEEVSRQAHEAMISYSETAAKESQQSHDAAIAYGESAAQKYLTALKVTLESVVNVLTKSSTAIAEVQKAMQESQDLIAALITSISTGQANLPTPYNADSVTWNQLPEPDKEKVRLLTKQVLSQYLSRKGINEILT